MRIRYRLLGLINYTNQVYNWIRLTKTKYCPLKQCLSVVRSEIQGF